MFTKTRYFDPSFINTIKEDQIYHGNWWLPENPNDRISGVLYLKRSGGIKLHLIGMFSNDSSEILGFKFADHPIIIGDNVPGGFHITLIGCEEEERRSPYLSNTTKDAAQKFNVNDLLMGCHINNTENLKFSQLEFSATYLTDWMDSKQVEIEIMDNRQTAVSTLPKKERFVAGKGYKITLTSWASTSLGGSYNSNEHSSIDIELDEAVSLEQFKERFQKPLIDLIQFGSGMLNSLTFLNVKPVGASELLKMASTNQFDKIRRSEDNIKHQALFLLSDLDDMESFTMNWLEYHNQIQHIFRLYFDSLHISFQFPITRFLSIIQALESFHAEKSKNNDLKLKVRLTQLFSEVGQSFFSLIPDPQNFIVRIVDTRNYYTHYNSKKKNKAADGSELIVMTFTLRLLLSYHLLISCGLDQNKCKTLIEKNRYFTSIKKSIQDNGY